MEQIALPLTYSLGPVCAVCLSHHRPDDPNNLHHCLIDGVRFKLGVQATSKSKDGHFLRFCSERCVRMWTKAKAEPRNEREALELSRALKEIATGREPKW